MSNRTADDAFPNLKAWHDKNGDLHTVVIAKQQLLADLLSLPEMQDAPIDMYSPTERNENYFQNKLRKGLRGSITTYFMGGDVGVDGGDSDSPELHEQHNVIKPVPEAPSKRKD